MSQIDITREHERSVAEVRKTIDRLARQMRERFQVETAWEGNTLHFERTGVNGAIVVSKGLVRVTAKLGFLLGALKGPIEREIESALDRELG